MMRRVALGGRVYGLLPVQIPEPSLIGGGISAILRACRASAIPRHSAPAGVQLSAGRSASALARPGLVWRHDPAARVVVVQHVDRREEAARLVPGAPLGGERLEVERQSGGAHAPTTSELITARSRRRETEVY